MAQLEALFLVLVANGAPLIAYDLLKDRWAWPVDRGRTLPDGRRLLGDSCTWRGWLAAGVCSVAAALLLGHGALLGLWIAVAAMAGDALSSLVKRRLGIESGGMAPGLDQIPESLLPLLAVRERMGLSGLDVLLLVAGFIVLELLLSRLLYHLRLRKQPY